jgi:hypothetical protein
MSPTKRSRSISPKPRGVKINYPRYNSTIKHNVYAIVPAHAYYRNAYNQILGKLGGYISNNRMVFLKKGKPVKIKNINQSKNVITYRIRND